MVAIRRPFWIPLLASVSLAGCSASSSPPHFNPSQLRSELTVINDTTHTATVAWCPRTAAVTSPRCGPQAPQQIRPGQRLILYYGPSQDGGNPGGRLVAMTKHGGVRCALLAGMPWPSGTAVHLRNNISASQCR